MALDSLQARARAVTLFERYGALLTAHQSAVMAMYFQSDWSLAEIAAHQGTSRSAVHDIIRRSTRALQDYDRKLGLLAEGVRRRRELAALDRDVTGLRRRIARLGA